MGKYSVDDNSKECPYKMFLLDVPADGLVSRHIILIFSLISHQMLHHDISLQWWLVYAINARTSENSHDLSNIFKILEDQIQPGPSANLLYN